jgi:hypothetical protein
MRRALVLAAALAALAGCGGGDGGKKAADGPAVIKAWADAVRSGRFTTANELFALPAVIANGDPKTTVTKRSEVDEFNRSLPCGAILLETVKSAGDHIVATFRLTDGAEGRDCGVGTGNKARVTFRIAEGHIVEWLREGEAPPPGSIET